MLRASQTHSIFYFPKRFLSSTTQIIRNDNLPAIAYKPEIVEKYKYDEWERKGIFKVHSKTQKPTFSIVLPPPNVTGKLHLG